VAEDPNNLSIYIEGNNTKIDKLTLYFEEERLSQVINNFYIILI
jgi:hypothetical protein